jgi:uncharacterized protein (DUF433 family)
MINLPAILDVPLRTDEYGTIRVGQTRVTLDTLIATYQRGDSPTDIHRSFPTVPLADIHAVISYYLAHQEEVDTYIREGEEKAEIARQEFEEKFPPNQALRDRLHRVKALVERVREEALNGELTNDLIPENSLPIPHEVT